MQEVFSLCADPFGSLVSAWTSQNNIANKILRITRDMNYVRIVEMSNFKNNLKCILYMLPYQYIK